LDLVGAMIVFTDVDGKITLMNRGGLELTKYEEEEILGKNIFDLLASDETREERKRTHDMVMRGEIEIPQDVENYILTKDGDPIAIKWRNMLIRNDDGKIRGVLSSGIDITTQKMIDELLFRQNAELSELAHIMSHDLGNKMKSITALVKLLKEEYDQEILDRISSIAETSTKLLQTSADLADAGVVIREKKQLDLDSIIKTVSDALPSKNVQVITGNLQPVWGSQERVEQIFQNLFVNAIEHGKATEINVKGERTPEGYCILISNNGAPIPQEIRPKIFLKDFTTKEGGLGLGLSIVKKMVEAHGWQVTLTNDLIPTFKICTSKVPSLDYK